MKFFHALALVILATHAHADLAIYHLNVGMGDATLIVDTQADKTLLVGAGNRSYGEKVVAKIIKKLGYSRIDYFVATNYDAYHIGGFDEIIETGIPFSVVYDRGNYTNRKLENQRGNATQYGEYVRMAGAARKKISLQNASCNENDSKVFEFGEDTTIDVVAVAGAFTDKDCVTDKKEIKNNEDNDLSIALVVRHGDFSYFIGGDLTGGGNDTTNMETAIAPAIGDIDVLKLNHHGSKTSSNKTFLNILRPEAIIISVGNKGANLRYGLPKQEVLDRVREIDTEPTVFLTNQGEGGTLKDAIVENGHIIIHTNGSSYTINDVVFSVDEAVE